MNWPTPDWKRGSTASRRIALPSVDFVTPREARRTMVQRLRLDAGRDLRVRTGMTECSFGKVRHWLANS